MAMTGFDPSKVRNSINKVKSAHFNLMDALGTRMQNQFVNGMKDIWACKDAQDFFNNEFKPSIESLINGANSTFESVVNSMNSAAEAWANNTNSSWSDVPFTPPQKKIDTSVILENINGVRGVDTANANSIANRLNVIATSAESALTDAQSAVRDCGFVGGSQEASLVNSLGTIKNNIKSASEDMLNRTKARIEKTVADYGELGSKITDAFSGK